MTLRRAVGAAFAASCALLLAALLVPGPAPADEGRTMTVEDVVRLFVQGESSDELIRRIRNSPVEFDLAEEMLQELRLAGLPDEVIVAMVQRQHELHPPAIPVPDPADEALGPAPELTVRLALKGETKPGKGDQDRGLRVIDFVPPGTLAQLGVRDDQARITDLALYIACHASTHVPDHWRGKTPLGRDFTSVTRHKMLAFHAGATEEPPGAAKAFLASLPGGRVPPKASGWTVLKLELPDELDVELDPTAEHDLSVGLAVKIDGRYYRVVSDDVEDFVPADHERSIDVTIEVPQDLDPASTVIRLTP